MSIKLTPAADVEDMQGAKLIHAVEDLLRDFLQQAATNGMTADEMRAASKVREQLRENRKLYGMEV